MVAVVAARRATTCILGIRIVWSLAAFEGFCSEVAMLFSALTHTKSRVFLTRLR